MGTPDDLPVLRTLDDVTRLIEGQDHLYVRWSRGPAKDLKAVSSKDDLTGVPMPGLSANSLDVEAWWENRPVKVWVARRLHDYSHLPREKGPDVHPWALRGRERGRGPVNEPLVGDVEPVGWIDGRVIEEAAAEVARQEGVWGPLRRRS
ncbi:DUF6098 family protein [Streptomyces agglomeratus]|uniref:DUF6098 family protein n=1 Tax=Streptomyces agglomeratus TaxID=285458 RepID=UPI000854DDBD|nr:DUF6098 family protein [Streptomyces agglomeratus]OEJ50230.1 hypothetical protein BGK72_05145 [Streptomyces agglomeratus]